MHNDCINMAKRLVVDSIWKSANLEGLGTTFPKTEAILENIPTETSREEVLFIVNMKRAWDFLLQNLDYNNCFMLIREFNKIVLDNLNEDSGRIRKGHVSIGGTSWTPGIPIDGDIYVKIEELNTIKEPLVKALKYFCFIARTQMFIDGNKRVAQLMANKILIENNVGIFQIPLEVLEPFKALLISFYESNDDTEIIDFMKSYCVRYVDGFVKEYKKPVEEVSSFEYSDIQTRFVLLDKQVSIFNSTLKNIRKLLVFKGFSGEFHLFEEVGNTYLQCNDFIYKVGSGYRVISGEGYTYIKDSLLDEFIVKTVKLLVKHIPFPIKNLYFSVNDKDLCFGDFVNSHEEEGSINIRLR